MASPRKSSVALAARERARAKAEEMTRRNEQLIELAAQFFVQDDRIAEIDADRDRKMEALRVQAEEKKVAAHQEASAIVQQMIETGESKKSVTERLGVTLTELKRYVATPAPAPVTEDESPNAETETDSSPAEAK